MFFNVGFASKRRVCRFLNLVQNCLVFRFLVGFGDKLQCSLEEYFEGLGRRIMAFIHKSKSIINVYAKNLVLNCRVVIAQVDSLIA